MQKLKISLSLGIAITLFACGPSSEEKSRIEKSLTDSASAAFISSTAAVENGKDSSRQFIRTAELKFKVKDVIKSTYDIENITHRKGGFVIFTNLTSNTNYVTTKAISADSSLETTYFTITNYITLRVPNTKLDSILKEISSTIDFLDYRIIKAEDVSLQILSNKLTQRRSAKNEERLTNAIKNRGKKLNETTTAEEILFSKQEQADKAGISNLSLTDQINFSTINLSIYQRETVKRELISNDKKSDAYEPGFGAKIFEALKYGWNILETVLVFIVKFWGLFLFALIAYFTYKRATHKLK